MARHSLFPTRWLCRSASTPPPSLGTTKAGQIPRTGPCGSLLPLQATTRFMQGKLRLGHGLDYGSNSDATLLSTFVQKMLRYARQVRLIQNDAKRCQDAGDRATGSLSGGQGGNAKACRRASGHFYGDILCHNAQACTCEHKDWTHLSRNWMTARYHPHHWVSRRPLQRPSRLMW